MIGLLVPMDASGMLSLFDAFITRKFQYNVIVLVAIKRVSKENGAFSRNQIK
jgi:hypothetical protein